MSNPFYTVSGNPATGAQGLSSLMRAEFVSIQVAFDVMPSFKTTGLFTTTFNQQGTYSFVLPNQAGTVALTSDVAVEGSRAATAEGVLTAAGTANAAAIASETARAVNVESSVAASVRTEATARIAALAGTLAPSAILVGNTGPSSWARTLPAAGLVTDGAQRITIVSPDSFSALITYLRTSDSGAGDAGGQAAYAIGNFVVNDNTVAVQNAYNAYFEMRRLAGTGAGQNIEISMNNYGNATTRSPFDITTTGDCISLLIGPGRDDLPTFDTTCAVFFGYSGAIRDARFRSGMTFHPESLRPNVHTAFGGGLYGASVAMDLCTGQSLVWRDPTTGRIASYIRADLGGTDAGGSIVFTDQGLDMRSANAGSQATVTNSGLAVYNLSVTNTISAASTITANGAIIITSAGNLTCQGYASFVGQMIATNLKTAVDDTSAAAAGVRSYGIYRNGATLQIRTS